MNIKAGKFYRCRDGSKARIHGLMGDAEKFPVYGAIKAQGYWFLAMWSAQGDYYYAPASSGKDLIAEWPDIEPTEAQVEACRSALRQCGISALDSEYRAIARAVLNAPKGE